MSSPADARAGTPRPYVLGHRGTNQGAPENTLLAFELARSVGADGIEFDVRLSADQRAVVIHDDNLSRVTSGLQSERVSELSLSELGKVDLGQGQGVPSLASVLAWAEERAVRLNIELKSERAGNRALVDAVAEELEAHLAPSTLLLSSFDFETIRLLRERLPGEAIAWLVDTESALFGAPERLAELGLSAINPGERLLDSRTIAHLKRHGLSIATWTVNSPERARALAALGVDTIISDVPGSILDALRRDSAPTRSS